MTDRPGRFRPPEGPRAPGMLTGLQAPLTTPVAGRVGARDRATETLVTGLAGELQESRRLHDLGRHEVVRAGLERLGARAHRLGAELGGDELERILASSQAMLAATLTALGDDATAAALNEQAAGRFAALRDRGAPLTALEESDYGMALQALGRWSEALPLLEHAVDVGARRPDAYRALGAAVAQQAVAEGRPELHGRAERLLREARALAPDEPLVVLATAAVQAAQGQRGEAAATCRGLGYALAREQRFGAALRAFLVGLEFEPDDEDALAGAAEMHRMLGDRGRARELAERILRRSPRSPVALTTKGLCLLDAGDAEDAVAPLQDAVDSAPDAVWAHANLALALQASGRIEEALVASERALELGGDLPGLAAQHAALLLAAGRSAEAIARLDALVDEHPDSGDARVALADALRREGSPASLERALTVIEGAVRRDPEAGAALATKGQILRQLGRAPDAAQVLTRALRISPDLSWAHSELGEALRTQGRFDDALSSFEEALRRDPTSVMALAGKGDVLMRRGEREEAIDLLTRALELVPDYAFALIKRGQSFYQDGRLGAARADLERAVALAPEEAEGHAWLGELLRMSGETELALSELDEAIALSPDAFALGTRGQVRAELRRLAPAVEDLRAAVRLAPELAWVRESLGDTLRLLGRNEEALAAYDALPEERRGAVEVRLKRVETLEALDRFVDALTELRAVLVHEPSNVHARVRQATLRCATGGFHKAVGILEEALRLSPDNDWAHFLRGWALRNLGGEQHLAEPDAARGREQLREAARAFGQAAELDATYPEYRQKLGDVLLVLEGSEAARPHFTWVVEEYARRPRERLDPYDVLVLAWSYFGLGRYGHAGRTLREALGQSGDDVPTHFDLGLALLADGRPALAEAEYERALAEAGREHPWRGCCHVRVARREFEEALRRGILPDEPEREAIRARLERAVHGGRLAAPGG